MARLSARGDRGSELVEFALVLPILLVIVGGVFDFGLLFQRYQVVTNAAREGARMAVLGGYTPADVQARVKSYLTAGGLNAALATITAVPTTITVPSAGAVAGFSFNAVTVTVAYPYTYFAIGPLARLVGGAGLGTATLTATTVMRSEL
jgi:Flp pilus assembly protein TadG